MVRTPPGANQQLGAFLEHRQEMAWYAQQRAGTAPGQLPAAGDPARQILDQAGEHYRQGRLAQSQALFEQLVAVPLFADQGHFGLGVIALAQGQLGQAANHFQQALHVNPGYANAHHYLGEIKEKLGSPAEAVTHYRSALACEPGHAGATKALARLGGTAAPATPPAQGLPSVQPSVAPAPVLAPVPLPSGSATLGVYEYLRGDSTLLARQTVAKLEALNLRRRASLVGWLGPLLLRVMVVLVLLVVSAFVRLTVAPDFNDDALWALGGLYLLVFAVRAGTTVFQVAGGRLTVERGILWRQVKQTELWRVQNIELRQGLVDRITGHGQLYFTLVGPRAKSVLVRGLARGARLRQLRAELFDLVFLLRSNPVVKGIIS